MQLQEKVRCRTKMGVWIFMAIPLTFWILENLNNILGEKLINYKIPTLPFSFLFPDIWLFFSLNEPMKTMEYSLTWGDILMMLCTDIPLSLSTAGKCRKEENFCASRICPLVWPSWTVIHKPCPEMTSLSTLKKKPKQ